MATASLVFLLVVLLLLALLAVPVGLDYEVSWRNRFQGRAVLHWLFGLVRVRLRPPASGKSKAPEPAAEASPAEWRKPASGPFNPLPALRQKTFRRRVFRFARDLWRALRKRDLYLHIRIGLGDPADTGQLWALCGPLSGWLAGVEDAAIELEPEFIDAVFEVDSSGRLSVIPLQLLYLTLGLLCSQAFRRGLRTMRRTT